MTVACKESSVSLIHWDVASALSICCSVSLSPLPSLPTPRQSPFTSRMVCCPLISGTTPYRCRQHQWGSHGICPPWFVSVLSVPPDTVWSRRKSCSLPGSLCFDSSDTREGSDCYQPYHEGKFPLAGHEVDGALNGAYESSHSEGDETPPGLPGSRYILFSAQPV